ncbi:unnamed protein product [Linum tenue]|uniref:Peptidylprolyl isomerase n=1 Tax=Linum tenue TaxID=586396 RepID=A0AAV0L5S8_9ROSI|nr:unnamed protein product [Linum tenue]
MALSASAIICPKSLCRAQTPLSISKPTCSCSCFSSSQLEFDRNAYSKPSLNSVPKRKNRIVDVGIELLSASVLALSPMDADATRIIEYYATVGEPLYKRARPLTMRIGVGKVKALSLTACQVIKGLDQGIFGGGGIPPMHIGK